MRVLFVVPNYEPAWVFGGVVRCVSTLCREMANIGVDITVYTTNVDGLGGVHPVKTGEPINVGGVTVYYFSTTFKRNSDWNSRALISMLSRTIRDFDIVYIAATWQWIGIAAGRIAHRNKVHYVVSTHGAFSQELLKKVNLKKMLYWHVFLKNSFKYASAIHFTTEYEKQQSILLLNKYPCFIVPNCLPTDAYISDGFDKVKMREAWGVPDGAFVLITVGRPDPKKNLDLLIISLSVILKKLPNTFLVIVGPHDNAYSRKIINLSLYMGISDHIIWTGYKIGDDLKECYACADIFVLPSKDENFGMVVAEAMACGIPVIISNCVGVAGDVLSRKAGIVTEVNADQVAKAIETLLVNQILYNEMSKNALSAAKELYNGERIASLMATAFSDIISNKRSTQCSWQYPNLLR